jgi:hypothetical protein
MAGSANTAALQMLRQNNTVKEILTLIHKITIIQACP